MSTQLKGISKIRYGINWFEELVNILSGPLLAISAAVAIIDLFTDGRIHTTIQPLAIGWAICQGFGLDFQLLSLGYKARATLNANKKWRFVGVLTIAILLGAVALQSGAIFAAQGTQGEGLARAIAQLGIDPTFLIYERATLAVLLIFIAGWNKHDSVIVETPVQVETTEAVQELVATVRELTFTVTQISRELPIVRIEEASVRPALTERKGVDSTVESTTLDRVKAYLVEHPDATTREVGQAMGFSATTASKWMQRVKESER